MKPANTIRHRKSITSAFRSIHVVIQWHSSTTASHVHLIHALSVWTRVEFKTEHRGIVTKLH